MLDNGLKSALVVIDAQVGPLWGTYQMEQTIAVMQQMIQKAESRNIPIFYVQHEEPEGGFLTRGSQFWQFFQGISPGSEDTIIHKQASDSFYETPLKESLEQKGIQHLVIVGARTEFCVDTTCRSALSHGFHVTLVEDGHTTVDSSLPAESIIKHHNLNLNAIQTPHASIQVLPSELANFENESL
ncbi:cysteine hydrolase family protein [Falsibacillus pallidus]|uniref:Nicotinamidase-related amidase n=1 Tax=Falsibacillus pallidus TaxID=493781 RepID=A0A370GXL0_9BACI|nr:cysteine hydrolase family protein [Falsibacillus pallidus]RDI48006.1 nicotinamidase-related amidase [Falsibacillus pallidus]